MAEAKRITSRRCFILSGLAALVGCSAQGRSAREVFEYKGGRYIVAIEEGYGGGSFQETYSVYVNDKLIGSATPPVVQKRPQGQRASDPIKTEIRGSFENIDVVANRLLRIEIGGIDISYEVFMDGQLVSVVDVL